MKREKEKEEPQNLAEAIEQEQEEEELTEEEEEETPGVDPVMAVWDESTKRPSDEQVELWKNTHGDIYMLILDEDEMYVWRPLARHEYKQLLQATQNEQAFMEHVVAKCVLWPNLPPEFIAGGKAGTVPTLHAVIMEGSNFVAPEIAMTLVRKL